MASLTNAGEALRSTKGKENFQRLTRLLMCGGVRILRETFDSFHSPTDLPLKLGDPTTKDQLKKAKLTKPMWDCLYPSPVTFGESSEFDITLIFRLLRTICNLTEPLTGWDNLPNSTDLSLEADLARIKFYRNTVYGHNRTMEITESQFSNLWREISEALLRIARGAISQAKRDEWKNSIFKLLHDPLTSEAQRYVDELQTWYKNDMEVREAVEQVRDDVQQVSSQVREQNCLIQQIIENQESILINIGVESFSQREQPTSSRHHLFKQPQPRGAEETSGEHVEGNRQDHPTELDIWRVILSFSESFNLLLNYLKVKLGVNVVSSREGSLLITVTCSSLQILEVLWEDYNSGHLNKVAEETLVTAKVLEKLGLDEVKLKTTIAKDDYRKCKESFLRSDKGTYGRVVTNGSKEQLEDEISQLCHKILEYKIGDYEKFYDPLEGEMEGCRLNIALFGMTGSGKSALINTIFQSLGLDSQPAVTQNTGKEGTTILETFLVPETPIALYDTRGFFELDKKEEGELFRILFGIERPGDVLTRGHEWVQKADAAGVAAYKLEKPPILDRIHVVLWVIKAIDIIFKTGHYRESIKFVQDRLKQEVIKIITVITFDDEIQKKANADEERAQLKEAATEVTGSDKKNVFIIAK